MHKNGKYMKTKLDNIVNVIFLIKTFPTNRII